MQPAENVTDLLARWKEGPEVHSRVMPLVYEELRHLAGCLFRNERSDHTLQPTGLVHEAYVRMIDSGPFKTRQHFFGSAARAMRRTLVDHARQRNAKKRWGSLERAELDETVAEAEQECRDIVDMDRALANLEKVDDRQARLTELRYFTGLTLREAAEVVGISYSTAKEDWAKAKTWLKKNLDA